MWDDWRWAEIGGRVQTAGINPLKISIRLIFPSSHHDAIPTSIPQPSFLSFPPFSLLSAYPTFFLATGKIRKFLTA